MMTINNIEVSSHFKKLLSSYSCWVNLQFESKKEKLLLYPNAHGSWEKQNVLQVILFREDKREAKQRDGNLKSNLPR